MSVVTIITALLSLFAGIGVFLIAIKLLSANLESVSGDKLKYLFAKTSKNNLFGIGIGTATTALIQSSGATSVMAIGFVNAGVMTLVQACAIVLGANVGTTITGQIVAIGLLGGGDMISASTILAALAGVGAFMIYFGKKDVLKKVGGLLSGFGLLFIGLHTMSSSMDVFAQDDLIQHFIASINFPGYSVLLVLVGIILTAIIQSSSVTSSIAITMYVTNLISLDQGIFLILGSNIGACVVVLLACIGSSRDSKRMAIFHLITNFVRVFLFLAIVEIITASTGKTVGNLFTVMFDDAVSPLRLSMFHTLFNIVTVLMIWPFMNLFVKLTKKIMPDKTVSSDAEVVPANHLSYIDDHFLSAPPIAVAQVRNEVVGMAELAMANFDNALDTVCTLDFSKAELFKRNEEHLNFLNREITRYIVKLSKTDLSEKDNVYVSTVFHSVSDLERIGDYAENIMEYAEKLHSIDKGFSEEAVSEIRELQFTIDQLYQKVMKVYVNTDFKTLKEAYVLEDMVDDMTNAMSNRHIDRLDQGICSPDVGAPYLSLTSNAERVADHFINIAKAVRSFTKRSKDNQKSLIEDNGKEHKEKLANKSAEESAKVFTGETPTVDENPDIDSDDTGK